MANITYSPPLSVAGFLTDEAFISLIVGPVGSTKTTAGIMKIAYHAKRMAPCTDGIRRSRAVWVRNTREQLNDTSIPDVLKWYPDGLAGAFLRTERKFILCFDDVECEILFRGLDDANDVRRLLSLQASFAIFDEFREINKEVFEAMQGRLGRYPDKMMVPHRPEWGVDAKGNPIGGCVTDTGEENQHLWGMTNPPDMDTFWERFLSNPPTNTHVFFQPSGLSLEADWVQFLPRDYYENLSQGKSEDWIDIYINAKFGKSLAGRPVFTSFRPEYHVAKSSLRPLRLPDRPLILGMDFGLNPSVTINQIDMRGRLLTFSAHTSDGMGVLRFCNQVLKPVLASQRFMGIPAIIIGDPAGVQRAQTDERSVFDILRQEGFQVLPARTNNIVARIAAVDHYLNLQIDMGAAHLIDPVDAKPLVNALRGGYRYKIKRTGEAEDSPEKNAHSHIADAHEYACLHADGGQRGQIVTGHLRNIRPVSSLGWA